jgi:lysozyme family protein
MRLQAALRLQQDGIIGPITLRTIAAHDLHWLITTIYYAQVVYYQRLDQPEFISGWLARSKRRFDAALKMIAN